MKTTETTKKTMYIYMYVGSRRPQIWHARLRVENSDLNENLAYINLADSPMCRCDEEEETTMHYLLRCLLYCSEWQSMYNIV